MKANELMIGDWVNYRGTFIKVTSLYDKGGSNEIGWGKIESTWVNGRCIEPIPLTREILEKNGFIRDMFYGEWQFDLDPFPFSVVQRKNNSWYLGREEHGIAHNREIIDISYVHELQHALRLCGIEKEIEL